MSRLFRHAACLAAAALLVAAPAGAQNALGAMDASQAAPLRGLHTADDLRDWAAVGRLDTGVSFCTATLIAPDRVLTAAHCLFGPDARRLPDESLVFSAGLRHGSAEAIRRVIGSDMPIGYSRPPDTPDMASVGQDVAILRLERPIPETMVRAIGLGTRAADRSPVTLVSYGALRAEYPSIEEDCRVLSSLQAVQVLSCRVVSGSSGAPVLRMGPAGPEIVAVVSGRSETDEGAVTVAVVAEDLVPTLLSRPASAQLATGPVRNSPGGAIVFHRVDQDTALRGGTGARFIRP